MGGKLGHKDPRAGELVVIIVGVAMMLSLAETAEAQTSVKPENRVQWYETDPGTNLTPDRNCSKYYGTVSYAICMQTRSSPTGGTGGSGGPTFGNPFGMGVDPFDGFYK